MRAGRLNLNVAILLTLIAAGWLLPFRRAAAEDGPALIALPPIADDDQPAWSTALLQEPPPADHEIDASLSKRLDDLEQKYADLQSDYDDLDEKGSEIEKKFENVASSGHEGSTAEFFGRIHLDYWAFPGDSPGVNAFETGDPDISPQDRFLLRRLRFGMEGNIWENMLYRLDMEFARGNEPEFRDVYIGVEELPVLQTVLVGNQKRPYGLDHINSSRYNIFLERPFIIEAFNQDNRRLGIQSWGCSEDLFWNWRYGVFNQRLVQDEGEYASDHYQGELAGRLSSTFFWWDEGRDYGHLAIAGAIADPDGSGLPGRATNEARFQTRPEARTQSRWLDTGVIDGADDYGLLGLENVLNFGPLQFVGEYQTLWLERNTPEELFFHGGYAYIAYTLTGEHVPWDRETGQLDRLMPYTYFYPGTTCVDGQRTGWGAWQVAYRYSYGDLSDQDVLGGVGHSHTLALVWYLNPWAKMQLNAIYGEIDDHAPVAGETYGSYGIIGTRFACDF